MQSTNDTTAPDHLRTWFLAFGPALNVAGLEKTLGMRPRNLRRWLRGEWQLSKANREKAEIWARFFGYDPERQYDSII